MKKLTDKEGAYRKIKEDVTLVPTWECSSKY